MDAAGNAAIPVTSANVTYDVAVPVISAAGPATGSAVNNTQVSYTLSKAVASGSITWTRTSGTADASSPHAQALSGTELSAGAHSAITLASNPTLVDGSVYSITYNATDAAANAATPVTNTNIAYDITAPTVAISGAPAIVNSMASFPVTITFGEPVTGFGVGGISVTNGSAGSFATTSSTVYTASITPNASGNIIIGIPAAAAKDPANNNNTASAPDTVIFDNVPPTVAISGAPTIVNSTASFPASITFSEPVTGFSSFQRRHRPVMSR